MALVTSRFIMLPMYKRYVPMKFKIRKKTSASKSVFYPFMTRSALHAVIGIITFAVVAQSVLARGVSQDQVGQKSVLGVIALNQGTNEGSDMVETADGPTHLPTHYTTRSGVLMASAAAPTDTPDEILAAPAASSDGVLKSDGAVDSTERQSIESYIVQGGDTISTIAEKFSVSIRTILWANNLSDTSVIRPGDTLQIPPVSGVVHQVKAGDTVDKIAAKYKANADDILSFNQLPTKDAIEVGDILIVPGGSIEQAVAPTPAAAPLRYNFIDRIFRGPVPPPANQRLKAHALATPNHKSTSTTVVSCTPVDIEGTTAHQFTLRQTVRWNLSLPTVRLRLSRHHQPWWWPQDALWTCLKIFVKPGQRDTRSDHCHCWFNRLLNRNTLAL